MTEEEYYHLLSEARDTIAPHRDGVDGIYPRVTGPYAKMGRDEWFRGPWMHYHNILFELKKEYRDE